MKFIGIRIELLFSVLFIILFSGIFWPPNSYFQEPTMPLDASDPYSSSASVLLSVFLIFACFARRDEMLRLLRPAWPILALLAFAYVSAFWSDVPALSLRRSTTLTLTTLLGIYLVARIEMPQLVSILVKVSAFAAVSTLLVMAFVPQWGVQGGVDYPNAWRGCYSSKNTLGMSCAFGIIIATYALWNGYGSRLIAAALIPVNLLLLHFSQSGTPEVILVATAYVAVLLMAFRRRDGLGLVTGFLLLLLGIIGAGLLVLDWTDVLLALNRSPTLTGRVRIWTIVAEMISRRPWLGYGYGSFWRHDGVDANIVWGVLKWLAPHAHNAFVETGLNLGIVGIGAVILLWLDAFYRGYRVLTVPQVRHVVLILSLLFAMLLENQTENEFFRPNAILWILFVYSFVHIGRDVLLYRAEHAVVVPPRLRPQIPAVASQMR